MSNPSPARLRRTRAAQHAVAIVLSLLAVCPALAAPGAAPAVVPTLSERLATALQPAGPPLPGGRPTRSEDARALEHMPAPIATSATSAPSGGPPPSRSMRAFSDIARSFEEIFHWGVVLRLLLGLAMAVSFAAVIAWHPRRATRLDPLSDLEEQKTLILLGLVGAVVAALVTARAEEGGDPMAGYLAFVIFGIGALMRFRTALENPKLTGKAILVVVIGIACGLNEWALAVWMTLAAFALMWFLDSHLACRVRIDLGGKHECDLEECANTARRVLLERECRVKSSGIEPDRRRVVVLAHLPVTLDPDALEAALRTALAAHGPTPDVRIMVR